VFPVNRKDGRTIDALDVASGARRTLVGVTGPIAATGGSYYYAPERAHSIRRIRNGSDELFLTLAVARPVDTLIASRDGRRLALTLYDQAENPELCIVEVASPVLRCLDLTISSARPAFSASGDALYVEGLGRAGLRRVPVAGEPAVEVLPDTAAVGGIAVSPSGATLVYSDCGARDELVAVPDGARPLTSDRGAAGPMFGPDGTLAYVRRGSPAALMIRSPDGALREHYTRPGAILSDVSIAPDGDAIAFVVGDKTAPGIYITYRSTLAPPNRLTEDPRDERPVFAGKHVLFTRYAGDGSSTVMRVSLDGSAVTPVSNRPRATRAHGGGRALLAAVDVRNFYWWDPVTERELPGPVLPEGKLAQYTGLSPDGRWLAFVTGAAAQEIWRMRTDGTGAAELVHELSEDHSAPAVAIDDDGQVVIIRSSWHGELWLARAHAGHPW
jgi:hypothetical protein